MGLCGSSLTEEEKQAINQSTSWDSDLTTDFKKEQKLIKLLLLGTGESGKSTIFKQMQILYEDGFSEFEKATFRHVIRRNAVEAIQTLIQAIEKFGLQMQRPESERAAKALLSLDSHASEFWTNAIPGHIHTLWRGEPALRTVYQQKAKLQLLDSTQYLFENIDRIGDQQYTPTQDDILRARLRTSGIVERLFTIRGVPFKFLDVGGQRNERRKWIHCFDGVTSIIFVASLSEYDQVLYEDEQENRLKEAIRVFSEICNNEGFVDTALILFLNKIDLFKEKIAHVPLTECFKDYRGDQSVEETTHFIEAKFMEGNTTDKLVFTHVTCATDTNNVERVFEACKLVILKANLKNLGLT